MVVRPVALAAPPQVTATRADQLRRDLRLQRCVHRHAARPDRRRADHAGTVAEDPDQTVRSPPTRPATRSVPVTVPAGTTYARFSLFDADVAPGSDIDLYVYNSAARWSAQRQRRSDEEVNLVEPGRRHLHGVRAWLGRAGGTSPFKLHTWLLGSTSAGNMTVTAPAIAKIGVKGAIAHHPQRPDIGDEVPGLGRLRR